jgi:PAS domain-containing protein
MGNYNEVPPDAFELLGAPADAACPGQCNPQSCLSFEESHRLFQQLQIQQFQLQSERKALRQATAARQEQEALLQEFNDLYDFAPVGYFNLDCTGIILALNLTGAALLKDERTFLIGRRLNSFISHDTRPRFHRLLAELFAGAPRGNCEMVFQQGTFPPLTVQAEAVLSPSGKECQTIIVDITERRRREGYREMGWEIVQILHQNEDLPESLRRVLAVIKMRSGFEVVGLRFKDGASVAPFSRSEFPGNVLFPEQVLVDLGAGRAPSPPGSCSGYPVDACTLVLSGLTDLAAPHCSPGGSFWSNDLPKLWGPGLQGERGCGAPAARGAGSLALIPIRHQGQILGLLQLQSRGKGRLTAQSIEHLETISACLGAALMHRQADGDRARLEKEIIQGAGVFHDSP